MFKKYLSFIFIFGLVSSHSQDGATCFRDLDCMSSLCEISVPKCSNPFIRDCQKRCTALGRSNIGYKRNGDVCVTNSECISGRCLSCRLESPGMPKVCR